jgi:transposase
MEKDNRWFVGIDWASEEHQVCVLDDQGKVVGERVVAHSGDGLETLTTWLIAFADGDATVVHVGIEVPHGAVVETLLERSFAVYAVNPKQLDRFRDRFTVAGAKDDRLDARVLADSLRTDRHCYRLLSIDSPTVIELREWSRMADELKRERVRLSNRIREQLRRYYPQMLELEQDVSSPWFLDLWELLPTPEKAAKARKAAVVRVLKKHRIRRIDEQKVLATLRQKPLTVAPGTATAATAHISAVVERLRVVNKQHKQAMRRLDDLCKAIAAQDDGDESGNQCEQHDVEILRSLPGVGRIVLAVLLAEAYRALEARDYHALRALCGVAPVTRRSGKRTVVVMRKACHPRLRDAIYH